MLSLSLQSQLALPRDLIVSQTDHLPDLKAPADYAKAPPTYRRQVWLALFGLFAFALFYVGLAGWFTYVTVSMILGAIVGGHGSVSALIGAIPFAFLAILMWKGLLFVHHGSEAPGHEITAADQPELFSFLNALADRIGAPRPHRVFVSPEVNAAVFFDLSIANLIIPTKKNLIIGLGLVNVLNRTELAAVLAHEFGHFAQRSMLVGRWVYIGDQLARAIIARRDFIDSFLEGLSRFDLRVAWIGWIMRIVFWSIRSVIETAFRWVVLAHRALSREMEFQADLVAVSVTGSDALIQALFRMRPADEDFSRSLNFAMQQFAKGHKVEDLFAIQTRIGELLTKLRNEPTHSGLPPEAEFAGPETRIFSETLAQPPKMWATHPASTEREANAKRNYLAAELDTRPAWTFFRDAEPLREAVTRFALKDVKREEKTTPQPIEESLAILDEDYSSLVFDRAYQGAYLGRPVTLAANEPSQLYAPAPPRDELPEQFEKLYPHELQDDLGGWRNLEEEIDLLEAVRLGHYEGAEAGVVRYRGKTIRRGKLAPLISEVKEERDEYLAKIESHEAQCRAVHDAAAVSIGNGWPEYLRSLTRLLHYAEHSTHDIQDAEQRLLNVTMMSTAAGKVNAKKLKRILDAANDLLAVAARLDQQVAKVRLPASVLATLKIEEWRSAFPELELPRAEEANINQWMNVYESWIHPITFSFRELAFAALAELLRAEKQVREIYLGQQEPTEAPAPAVVPKEYITRVRGNERERVTKLDWWSQFLLADGAMPSTLRFLVSGSLVAAVILAGVFVGAPTVTAYNGLERPVQVTINGRTELLAPYQRKKFTASTTLPRFVRTQTEDGRSIESFWKFTPASFGDYVYNVSRAAPLVEWTQGYGNAASGDEVYLGAPRWVLTSARHIFEDAPAQIEVEGNGGTRRILETDTSHQPYSVIYQVDEEADKEALIRAHAMWDSGDAEYIYQWMQLARGLEDFPEILSRRLEQNPDEVISLRLMYDTAEGEEQERIKKLLLEEAAQHPDNPNWQYIAARLLPDGPEQDDAMIRLSKRWPSHPWLSNAAGYVYISKGQWEEAKKHYTACIERPCPTRGAAASELARLRRLQSSERAVWLNLTSYDYSLKLNWEIENSDNVRGTPFYFYTLLNRGKLEEASQQIGDSPSEPRPLVLLGTSDGARPEWQLDAANVPLEDITQAELLLYLAALAARNGEDAEPYLARIELLEPEDGKLANRFREWIAEQPANDEIEAKLLGFQLRERGILLAALGILYPGDLDEKWKKEVRALLFATERPSI